MFKSIIALLLLATVANAGEIEWGDCESNMAYVSSVSLTGCSSAPCDLVTGQSYSIRVSALAVHDSSSLPYQVTFWDQGDIVYASPHGNVCDILGLGSCPHLSFTNIGFGVGITVCYDSNNLKFLIRYDTYCTLE